MLSQNGYGSEFQFPPTFGARLLLRRPSRELNRVRLPGSDWDEHCPGTAWRDERKSDDRVSGPVGAPRVRT